MATSRRRDEEFPLAVGRKGEASMNVLSGKLRKILKNLILRHTSGQVLKNILHCNSHAANTRFAAALAGLDRDDFRVIHGRRIVQQLSN